MATSTITAEPIRPTIEAEVSKPHDSHRQTSTAPQLEHFAVPAGVRTKQLIWSYVIAFSVMHALLPLAFVPWFFSWTALIATPVLIYIFATLGVNLTYHRILTHRGLALPKWLERTFATFGMCCLTESPARWVAIHRMHHQFSDQQPDPHSPLAGFFWAHMEWLVRPNHDTSTAEMYDRYARDLIRDPYYFRCERNGWWWQIYVAHVAIIFLAGLAAGYLWMGTWMGGLQLASSLIVWGVIVRTVYVWHVTWAVNSFAHVQGYRNYETSDASRNNWWVALATNGEGWHNNHHADQVACAHGHRWWEFDVTYITVCILEFVGLATNVKRPREWEKH